MDVAKECARTRLEEFVQHHSFYKLILEDYHHVLQTASLLCLLYNRGGRYVNVGKRRDIILSSAVDPRDKRIVGRMEEMKKRLPVIPTFDNKQRWMKQRGKFGTTWKLELCTQSL